MLNFTVLIFGLLFLCQDRLFLTCPGCLWSGIRLYFWIASALACPLSEFWLLSYVVRRYLPHWTLTFLWTLATDYLFYRRLFWIYRAESFMRRNCHFQPLFPPDPSIRPSVEIDFIKVNAPISTRCVCVRLSVPPEKY